MPNNLGLSLPSLGIDVGNWSGELDMDLYIKPRRCGPGRTTFLGFIGILGYCTLKMGAKLEGAFRRGFMWNK